MNIFKSNAEIHHEHLDEEFLYGAVAQEMSNGVISPGLHTKALSECNGDEKAATAKYIKLRVEMMKSERAAINERDRLAQIEMAKIQSAEEARQRQPITPISNTSTSQLSPSIRIFCVLFGILFIAIPFLEKKWPTSLLDIVGLLLFFGCMVGMGVWFLVCGVLGKSLDPFTGAEK